MKNKAIFLLLFYCSLSITSSHAADANVAEICSFYANMYLGIHNQKTVINTKLLSFKEPINTVVNGSIIEYENDYLMVFRHDTRQRLCSECPLTRSEINMVKLDQEFNQKSPIQTVALTSSYDPEDPRVYQCNGELFIVYNDEPIIHQHINGHPKWLGRRLFTGKLDPITASLTNIVQVPHAGILLTFREKNWVPFEHQGNAHFIYATDPYTIIDITNLKDSPSESRCRTIPLNVYNFWDKDLWGPINGGTPARLVDDVYLTFFHTWKWSPDKRNLYYVMGAYTFEPNPPFKITAITPNPILFQDAFTAKHLEDWKHVVYPAGFVIDKKSKKTILHVSCGENDASTRIVSMDWDILKQTMVPVD